MEFRTINLWAWQVHTWASSKVNAESVRYVWYSLQSLHFECVHCIALDSWLFNDLTTLGNEHSVCIVISITYPSKTSLWHKSNFHIDIHLRSNAVCSVSYHQKHHSRLILITIYIWLTGFESWYIPGIDIWNPKLN